MPPGCCPTWLKEPFNVRLQFGLIDRVPEGEFDAHLQQVVNDFLRLYGERIHGGSAGKEAGYRAIGP